MMKKLGWTDGRKEAGVRPTVQLQWTLLLMEAQHRDASFEHKDGFKTVELDDIWNAVQGNTFAFLAGSVAKFCK